MIKTELRLRRFRLDGIPLEDGKFFEERKQEARSWLKHFLDLFYCHISDTTLAFNDIGGVSRTVKAEAFSMNGSFAVGAPPGGIFACLPASPATSAEFNLSATRLGNLIGIVIGTSNLAVISTQDALQAQIAHGEDAGQLLYGGCELYGLNFVDSNGQFAIRRYFTNILGGAVTVQEIGIYAHGVVSDRNGYSFCIARDVVAPGITVNNGQILEVTYTPQITV